MRNEMRIFEHPDFGSIKTLMIDDELWFIGIEIAEILGYVKARNALISHVDKEDKRVIQKPYFGALENIPNRGLTCINESGLYSLILASKLPAARKFQRWVTSEVIPSIRKHGAYLTNEKIEEILLSPDTIIKLATDLKHERERNSELSAENTALAMKANTWNERAIINALIRTYANRKLGNNFRLAWNKFYKQLNYGEKIGLRHRKIHKTGCRLLDLLTESEFKIALKQAVAMCEEAGIDAGAVINEVNLKKVSAK